MAHFIEGLDRQQAMLLPEHLEDYVDVKWSGKFGQRAKMMDWMPLLSAS
jgi:hypothetical protein